MRCQIGIYRETYAEYEEWAGLICLDSTLSPKDILNELGPFLRRFHCTHGMEDAGGLAAWLAWKLIDIRSEDEVAFSGISLERELAIDIDYFYRVTPGSVEVFRVDEVLEWNPVARLEVECQANEEEMVEAESQSN
jgi:hypothetical protein